GNGRPSPAAASRFNVSRTVDDATPTRRAISLIATPAVFKRSTSRTWRIASLLASSPPWQAKGADAKRASRDAVRPVTIRATSSRNSGRNHLGTPSEIKSEWRARSLRIRGRLPPESARATAVRGSAAVSERPIQTLVEIQAIVQVGPDDPDLAAAVAKLTGDPLGPSDSYRAI